MPMCSCGKNQVKIVWSQTEDYVQPFSGLRTPVFQGNFGTCGNDCLPVPIPYDFKLTQVDLPPGVTLRSECPTTESTKPLPSPQINSGDDPDWYLWIP